MKYFIRKLFFLNYIRKYKNIWKHILYIVFETVVKVEIIRGIKEAIRKVKVVETGFGVKIDIYLYWWGVASTILNSLHFFSITNSNKDLFNFPKSQCHLAATSYDTKFFDHCTCKCQRMCFIRHLISNASFREKGLWLLSRKLALLSCSWKSAQVSNVTRLEGMNSLYPL